MVAPKPAFGVSDFGNFCLGLPEPRPLRCFLNQRCLFVDPFIVLFVADIRNATRVVLIWIPGQYRQELFKEPVGETRDILHWTEWPFHRGIR